MQQMMKAIDDTKHHLKMTIYSLGKHLHNGATPVQQVYASSSNTETNPNVPDARNWQGSGNRSVTNMFIDLGMRVTMTDEQFAEEMEMRRQKLDLGPNDHVIGCPLCLTPLVWPIEETGASSDD